jgi:hypothetical protein
MDPIILLPESVARQDGAGAEVPLGNAAGKPLLLTLEVTRIMELESLEVSVWGSPDREHWTLVQSFPKKYYCGTYSSLVNLSGRREIRYLRAEWKMTQWGHEGAEPLFGFHLSAAEAVLEAAGA